jgi:hypothetical protein
MRRLFTDPDGFFGSLGEPGLRTPCAIVALLTVIGLGTSGLYARRMVAGLSEGVAGILLLVALVSGGITAVVLPFAGWLFFSGCFHTVANRYTETATFRRTFAYVGYGFVPFVLFRICYGIGTAVAVLSTPPPASIGAIGQFDAAVSSHPLSTTVEWLTPVFFLWSAFLWVFAVRHAHDLDRRTSLKLVLFVLVPVGISYLWLTVDPNLGALGGVLVSWPARARTAAW